MVKSLPIAALSLLGFALASCGNTTAGDSAAQTATGTAGIETNLAIEVFGTFAEPWAAAFEPGTNIVFITEQGGTMKFVDTSSGRTGTVTGVPEVDYGGQGGLGDIAFSPDYATSKAIYLTWAETGDGNTRGAALGRGLLDCNEQDRCDIREFEVIWRQAPKVTGRGHYSHRIAFSPNGDHLFLTSGDRQKKSPAQDLGNTLGTIVRLNLDGSAAIDNPFADQGTPTDQIWSWGHRNMLGIEFDTNGRLWVVEHGPKGGDELNLIRRGANYGWPEVSNGVHYSGTAIPDHQTRPEFEPPKISWTPVIAPGDMTFVSSDRFSGWQGDLIIAGLKSKALVRVTFDGEIAQEEARYDMEKRLRAVVEGPEGALWVLEDGAEGRLLKITPR